MALSSSWGRFPAELAVLFLAQLLTAFFTGCWALMFSSLFRRTVSAIIASYALTLFLAGGTPDFVPPDS